MTYTIANSFNSTFNREQIRWETAAGTIEMRHYHSVPKGTHELLRLPYSCEVYLTPCGAYAATLNDAIAITEMDAEDFDSYPANDEEFVEFMTAATSNITITPHEPKDQTEAIAIANGEIWSDVGIYAEWAGFGRIEASHYRKLGTVKERNGKVEYQAIGHFRLCRSAGSVEDAIEQIKQSFIRTQSPRHAAAWHEYLDTQTDARNRFASDLLSL